MAQTYSLSPEQIRQFDADGFLLIKGFYDLNSEILPIQRGIYDIIRMVAADHARHLDIAPFAPHTFDAGYQQLIAFDRALGAIVYDAVKQLPAFLRLLASTKHEGVIKQLRRCKVAGIAAGGYGIRIDNPGEDRFNTTWHNDYFAHLRSKSGVVYWASLVQFTPDMGPVQLCKGSHTADVRLVEVPSEKQISASSYQELAKNFRIRDLDRLLATYGIVAPLPNVGDLLLIDFMTIHASGNNVGTRSRWSMQMRIFCFDDEAGRKIKWTGSFAAGKDFRDIHPEMIAHE